MSPLAGPFYLLLRLLLCPGHPAYCVTYTWHSKLHSVTEEDFFLLCHLYLPQFMQKKSRDNIEKNDISRPLLPVKLFKILSAFTELANPKKNLANTPADLKKNEIENEKNDGIAALSIIINCFCRQNVTEKLENSGKDFKWRGDRTEDGEERAGRVLVGRQTVRLWWFYIILWLWNLIPKDFIHPPLYQHSPYP